MKEIKDLGFGVIQVNETKPTISKTESVDNYLCKWQKLKEWLEESISSMSDSANYRQKEQLKFVIQKMQELEGE